MSEATGMEAKTIHRLLEFNPQDGYKRNEENPLEGDALIVDECSMIDIILMYNLMKAIPEHMRLVLVGDMTSCRVWEPETFCATSSTQRKFRSSDSPASSDRHSRAESS